MQRHLRRLARAHRDRRAWRFSLAPATASARPDRSASQEEQAAAGSDWETATLAGGVVALLVVGALGVAAADDRRYLPQAPDRGAERVSLLAMPRFEEAITGTLDVLQRRGRVSYAAIARQYGLSPDDLEALKDELIEILGAARDEAGKMLVAVEQAPREGAPERRLVSVMACDLVASTPLSRRLDPEQLRDVIRAYQASVEAAIERHGGHAARWQGDGVMVYFGYPRAEEDDAVRAVRCGWEILRDLEEVRERVAARYGVTLQARVGVHCGTVVVGDDGVDRLAGLRRDAERRRARRGRLRARRRSRSRRRSASSSAGTSTSSRSAPHELKGVEEPIELFRVVAPRAQRRALRGRARRAPGPAGRPRGRARRCSARPPTAPARARGPRSC